MDKNFYEILGITKNASQDEIKIAYKKLVKQFHPDKFQDYNEKEKATKILQTINYIYDTLSDEKSRKEYDETLENNSHTYSQQTLNNFNKNKNYSENFQTGVLGCLGKIILCFFTVFILNVILNFYQDNFTYKEEKAQLKILENEIKHLENELNIKKIEIEKNYDIEKLKKERLYIDIYEDKLAFLENQYKKAPNNELYLEYDKTLKSYNNCITRYNLIIKNFQNDYDNFNKKLNIYNKKIEEYNKIASKIKHYNIIIAPKIKK